MKLEFVRIYRGIRVILRYFSYLFMKAFARIGLVFSKNDIRFIDPLEQSKGSPQITFFGEIDSNSFFENKLSIFSHGAEGAVSFCCINSKQQQGINPGLFNVSALNNSIFKLGNINLGICFFDLEKSDACIPSAFEIVKKVEALKLKGSNYNIIYIRKGKEQVANESGIKRKFGSYGFDFVVGVSPTIKGKKNFRAVNFGETRVAYSLGRLSLNKNLYNLSGTIKGKRIKAKFNAKPALGIKIQLKKINKKVRLQKEGYIPLFVSLDGARVTDVFEIKKDAMDAGRLEKNYYLYIEKLMYGMRNFRELYTLKDIADVIGVKIPKRYSYLSSFSINQICARTYELAPGNIFFLRQSFKDKNDLNPESESARNRLVMRAFTRKALFTFSYKRLPKIIPHIVIDDPMEAHIKVMSWFKERYISSSYIGITGSIGKTSTKDMIYYVLREGYNVNRSTRNTNVQVKIGINLQKIPSDCQIYVQEIGGGRPGGASRHSRMVLPELTVITNIGTAHIGNYESKEDLRDNKLMIIDGMREDGILFLNADDPLLFEVKPKCNVVYFAVNNKEADYYAENLRNISGATYFDIVHQGKRVPMKINVLGEYNVLNAVCSYAIAKYFNMKDLNIRTGLQNFITTGSRQNLFATGGYRFFVDCYNASVDSIDNSLSVLSKLVPKPTGRRIAIIGDVTGMGEQQEVINEQIADIIASYDIDKVICYGNNAKFISDRLATYNKESVCINDADELENWMANNITKADVTMLKGSSKMRLDERLDYVYGTNLSDQRYIDEAEYSTLRKHSMTYRVFENHVSIRNANSKAESISIKGKIMGRDIKKISPRAFYNNNTLKEVIVGENILHIGSEAFANCKELERVVLNDKVKFIGKGAFSNCKKLKEINFSDSLIFIGKDAFDGCTKLSR